MQEILLIDKPKGITSYDVIRALKKRLKIQKMGHAGTLDPLATGLLIIGIGKGTKKLKEFLNLPKTYYMEVLLGKSTETGDLDGRVTQEIEVQQVDLDRLKETLHNLEGEIELPIPLYSAVKHKGIPLYKYARRGIKIAPRFRKAQIFSLKMLDLFKEGKFYILKIQMHCAKGTYARSLGEEIGRRLSLPATLKEVRRLKIGDFDIGQAQKLEETELV